MALIPQLMKATLFWNAASKIVASFFVGDSIMAAIPGFKGKKEKESVITMFNNIKKKKKKKHDRGVGRSDALASAQDHEFELPAEKVCLVFSLVQV